MKPAVVLLSLGMLFAGCSRVQPEHVAIEPITAAGLWQLASNSNARVTLVVVWATWCGPCREEFPHLLRLERRWRGQGMKLVLVSADSVEDVPTVKRFLARHGVDFLTYLKAEKDMEFINGLEPRWGGALPASFLFDERGKLVDFWQGAATYETVAAKIHRILEGK